MRLKTRNLVLSGLFIALGYVMPFFTMQVPTIGSMLCPMHIPILLCGFLCGAPYGAIVGFITPLLRSAIVGMPPSYTALAMAFELAAYGFLSGIFYKMLPKKPILIYVDLILAMIGGRIIWGITSLLLYGIRGNAFTLAIFLNGATSAQMDKNKTAFLEWLLTQKSYSQRAANDVVSRIKRANKICYIEDIPNDKYIFELERESEFKELSVSVRSQMKRATTLYCNYLQESL